MPPSSCVTTFLIRIFFDLTFLVIFANNGPICLLIYDPIFEPYARLFWGENWSNFLPVWVKSSISMFWLLIIMMTTLYFEFVILSVSGCHIETTVMTMEYLIGQLDNCDSPGRALS